MGRAQNARSATSAESPNFDACYHTPTETAWGAVHGLFKNETLRKSTQRYYKDNLLLLLSPASSSRSGWGGEEKETWDLMSKPLPRSTCSEPFILFGYGEQDGCFDRSIAEEKGRQEAGALRFEVIPKVGHFNRRSSIRKHSTVLPAPPPMIIHQNATPAVKQK